jgi:hypothetical protein
VFYGAGELWEGNFLEEEGGDGDADGQKKKRRKKKAEAPEEFFVRSGW